MKRPFFSRPRIQRELLRRTTVGVALIVLAVGDVWLGWVYFWALISLASILMMGEWSNLVKAGLRKRFAQASVALPLLLAAPVSNLPDQAISLPWATYIFSPAAIFPGPSITVLIVLAAMFGIVAIGSRSLRLAAGLFYVGLPAIALVYLRELDFGHMIAMWTLALVWATDIGAFFVGRTLRGPKVWPAVSPNKTWSGSIGGVLCALLCGFAFLQFDSHFPLWMALASAPLSAVAQAGDFFESYLKRRAGVKDSGNLLPGHGGIMDRLDGLVPVAPLVALLWIWWML